MTTYYSGNDSEISYGSTRLSPILYQDRESTHRCQRWSIPSTATLSGLTSDLVKNKDIVIPPVVLHLGSDRSSEERGKWEVFYRGMPKICYRCLKEGDIADIQHLARNTVYEEAPAAPSDTDVISGERRTFDFMKDNSFVQKREEIAAKAREEQKMRESRKKGICGGEENWLREWKWQPEVKINLSLFSWNYTMFYFH